MQCSDCGQEFTGTYKFGNLSRHQKQKHLAAKEGSYQCTSPGCSSVFSRSDARLKHARIKHPGLRLPPAQRRQGTEYATPSRSLNYDNAVGKELNLGPNVINDLSGHLHNGASPAGELYKYSAPANYIVSTLANRLGPAELARAYDSFFTRWESIVEQMLNDKFDTHPVYAQVLNDIRHIVYGVAHTEHGSQAPSDGESSRPTSNRQVSSRGSGLDNLGRSLSDRITKRGSSSGGAGRNLVNTVEKRARVEGRQEVDCPVYKHHVMHGLHPPCQGCRVTVMSQVRSHLNPDRASGTHRGFPRFIEQCHRCKQDFIDRQSYDAHTAANRCAFQKQIRGEILLPWARQYLTLYPNTAKVPLPWPDTRGWIQESLLVQLRDLRSANVDFATFLDGRRDLRLSQTRSIPSNLANHAQYTGAMGHVLYDLVNPTFTRPASLSSLAPPVLNESHDYRTALQSPFIGGTGSNNRHWQNVLRSLESHQRTFREAAAYLTPQQLGYMAVQSARVSAISRGLYRQQQQSQVMHDQTIPSGMNDGLVVRASSTLAQGLGASLHARRPYYDQPSIQYAASDTGPVTPSTDRTRSDRSYAARSSQRLHSSLTNPSSSHSLRNSDLLSPNSPTDYRRASLPSNVRPEPRRLSRAWPSRLSLPDNADDCIDPSLLDTSRDDDSPESIDRRFYSPGNGY